MSARCGSADLSYFNLQSLVAFRTYSIMLPLLFRKAESRLAFGTGPVYVILVGEALFKNREKVLDFVPCRKIYVVFSSSCNYIFREESEEYKNHRKKSKEGKNQGLKENPENEKNKIYNDTRFVKLIGTVSSLHKPCKLIT